MENPRAIVHAETQNEAALRTEETGLLEDSHPRLITTVMTSLLRALSPSHTPTKVQLRRATTSRMTFIRRLSHLQKFTLTEK